MTEIEPSTLRILNTTGRSETIDALPRRQYIGDALPYQAVCPNLPIEP
jgi:hypothetical protein